MNRRIALLSTGHLWTDFCQGAVPALLPFFVSGLHISLAAAGGLIFAANISSSLLQPAFGHLADRRSAPWLMPAGLALSAGCIAISGFLTHYGILFAALTLAGIGTAAFHPEAVRFVNLAARQEKSSPTAAMSLFAVGGNIGFALGPMVATALVVAWGLHGAAGLVLLPFAGAAALILFLPDFAALTRFHDNDHAGRAAAAGQDQWGPFARLTGAVMIRSVLFFGFNTFVPLYWLRVLHAGNTGAGLALSLFLAAGAAGTILGGWMAPWFGRRRVLVWSFALLGPLIVLLLLAQQSWLALLLLIPVGVVAFAPFSVMVVLGHEYLPARVGTSSGVTFGLAVTVGGVFAPLLGKFADHHGLPAMFLILAALPLFAWLLSVSLPSHSSPTKEQAQPASAAS